MGIKLQQGRSPAYPYIPLNKAIERAEAVHAAGVGKSAYPPSIFYKVWELGESSSGARQTMAALNHFGLVDYEGRGESRKVRLTELALKIVQDKRPLSVSRTQAIQDAALSPPIHKKLYQQFPPPLPEDVFIEHFLINEAGYNPSAATSLIAEFKDTLAYAELNLPGNMSDEGDGEAAEKDQSEDNLDEDGAPTESTDLTRKKKVKLEVNERELTTGILSKRASFRLIVSGEIGVKEIERLIAKLELDKEILAEADDDNGDILNY